MKYRTFRLRATRSNYILDGYITMLIANGIDFCVTKVVNGYDVKVPANIPEHCFPLEKDLVK